MARFTTIRLEAGEVLTLALQYLDIVAGREVDAPDVRIRGRTADNQLCQIFVGADVAESAFKAAQVPLVMPEFDPLRLDRLQGLPIRVPLTVYTFAVVQPPNKDYTVFKVIPRPEEEPGAAAEGEAPKRFPPRQDVRQVMREAVRFVLEEIEPEFSKRDIVVTGDALASMSQTIVNKVVR